MNRNELKTKAINAANEGLRNKGYISAVDVLMAMGKLSREDHERWRFRQIPYLERVLRGNLAQFEVLLRTVRAYARDQLRLKSSRTVYTSWGKGPRQPLRFTKSGIAHLEELYSTHFVSHSRAHPKPSPDHSDAGVQPTPGATSSTVSSDPGLLDEP